MTALHILKLSVGTEDIADLAAWQDTKRAQAPDGCPRHVTRMWPRRADEVLAGGSIYWVIKGVILCRQPILRFDAYEGADGIARCAIVLDPGLVRVAATPKRPFQGWRYLPGPDAPPDMPADRQTEEALPPSSAAPSPTSASAERHPTRFFLPEKLPREGRRRNERRLRSIPHPADDQSGTPSSPSRAISPPNAAFSAPLHPASCPANNVA